MKITIETIVKATIGDVWEAWVNPSDIVNWNFASDEWCCPRATLNLTEGGAFNYRMEAKDGSMGFDFEGVFTKINANSLIEYELGDNRKVGIEFCQVGDSVRVTETFEAEDENSAELQKQGWQAILNNFKNHVESKSI